MKKDYVLVGGGIAALRSAKAIRTRDTGGRLVMLSGENHKPYSRPALSGVLAKDAACETLELEKPGFYEENNIDLRCGATVTRIDPGQKQVVLADGESLPYTHLLLATGAQPFNPIESAPDAVPVLALRCYEDAVRIAELAAGRRVVLVGGGILGLEAALSLRQRGAEVTVVEFAPRILPLQTDEEVSAQLQTRLEEAGIVVLTGMSVSTATAQGVVFTNGAEMAADLVLASMGVRSEVSLAVALGLELSRGIVVNSYMHTSHPDIWAAGDCAEYDGRVVAMAGAAGAMGEVAGASMAGDEAVPYHHITPVTMLAVENRFKLFSVGALSEDTGESALYRNGEKDLYRRLFFCEGALCGALLAGTEANGAAYIPAVKRGAPLADTIGLLA